MTRCSISIVVYGFLILYLTHEASLCSTHFTSSCKGEKSARSSPLKSSLSASSSIPHSEASGVRMLDQVEAAHNEAQKDKANPIRSILLRKRRAMKPEISSLDDPEGVSHEQIDRVGRRILGKNESQSANGTNYSIKSLNKGYYEAKEAYEHPEKAKPAAKAGAATPAAGGGNETSTDETEAEGATSAPGAEDSTGPTEAEGATSAPGAEDSTGPTEAGGAATEAGGAATEAGGAATEAGGAATEAGGAATEAEGAATEAGGAVTEAGGAVTEAGGAATEAGGAATEAATEAAR